MAFLGDQSLALRKSQNGKSKRRRRVSATWRRPRLLTIKAPRSAQAINEDLSSGSPLRHTAAKESVPTAIQEMFGVE
jgi:hypothetical protein